MDHHLFALFFQLLIHLLTNYHVFIGVLIPSAASEYTVIDSFHFAEEICQQDPNLHMASLDADSLLTNIPLDETIDICGDSLCNGKENPPNIPENDFGNLLIIASKESFLHLARNINR